jgi:hypothetical protein
MAPSSFRSVRLLIGFERNMNSISITVITHHHDHDQHPSPGAHLAESFELTWKGSSHQSLTFGQILFFTCSDFSFFFGYKLCRCSAVHISQRIFIDKGISVLAILQFTLVSC